MVVVGAALRLGDALAPAWRSGSVLVVFRRGHRVQRSVLAGALADGVRDCEMPSDNCDESEPQKLPNITKIMAQPSG